MPVVAPMGQRWINAEKARYYRVVLEKDLFGTWSLIACWGALHSRRGGMRGHRAGVARCRGCGVGRDREATAAAGVCAGASAARPLGVINAPTSESLEAMDWNRLW
jgi:hypothetical protein